MKIKINSNPYLKKIKYSIYDEKFNDWQEVCDNGNKLLSSKFSDGDLENIIDDIILYVKEAYLTNEDSDIEIVYEGTDEEYIILTNKIKSQENIKLKKSDKSLDSKNEIIGNLDAIDNDISQSFHYEHANLLNDEFNYEKTYKCINDKLYQIEIQTNDIIEKYNKIYQKKKNDFIESISTEFNEFYNKALENLYSYDILLNEEIGKINNETSLNSNDLFNDETMKRVASLYHKAVEEIKLDLNDLFKKYDKQAMNFNLYFNNDKRNEKNLNSKSLKNLQELLTTNDIKFVYSYIIDIYYLAYLYFIVCVKDALIGYNKTYNSDNTKINELIESMYDTLVNKYRNLRVINYINKYKTKLISIFDAK